MFTKDYHDGSALKNKEIKNFSQLANQIQNVPKNNLKLPNWFHFRKILPGGSLKQ